MPKPDKEVCIVEQNECDLAGEPLPSANNKKRNKETADNAVEILGQALNEFKFFIG